VITSTHEGNTFKNHVSAVNSSSQQDPLHNVVVFGGSGVGKSSVINMIAGSVVAKTSPDASNCTLKSTSHTVTLNNNKHIKLWDTVGLPEGQMGIIAKVGAGVRLGRLLKQLDNRISLLVLCMRKPRVGNKDYKMFYDKLCHQKVPIILVVTGLEEEEPMESWWESNKGWFKEQGMSFDGHACITATKGKLKDDKHLFAQEYEKSREKVLQLIEQHCSADVQNLEGPRPSMIDAVKIMFNMGTNTSDANSDKSVSAHTARR